MLSVPHYGHAALSCSLVNVDSCGGCGVGAVAEYIPEFIQVNTHHGGVEAIIEDRVEFGSTNPRAQQPFKEDVGSKSNSPGSKRVSDMTCVTG